MVVQAVGHWGGDPARAAESLTVRARSLAEARQLAELYQFLRQHPAGIEVLADLVAGFAAADSDLASVGIGG